MRIGPAKRRLRTEFDLHPMDLFCAAAVSKMNRGTMHVLRLGWTTPILRAILPGCAAWIHGNLFGKTLNQPRATQEIPYLMTPRRVRQYSFLSQLRRVKQR